MGDKYVEKLRQLRENAEKELSKKEPHSTLSTEIDRLTHELHVHEIELEIQTRKC